MLTLRKHRAKIPIKKLISVTIIWWKRQDWFWHFDNILRDDLIRFFQVLLDWRILLFNLKLRRNILLQTHGSLTINFLELWFFGYLFVLIKQRVFGLAKLFLKHKLASHEKLTCDNNVQKTIFVRVNIAVLIYMCI